MCAGPLPLLLPADKQAIRGQRIELHLLAQLHAGGCGARMVKPLAVFRYAGEWLDDPEKRAKLWYEVSGAADQTCALAPSAGRRVGADLGSDH